MLNLILNKNKLSFNKLKEQLPFVILTCILLLLFILLYKGLISFFIVKTGSMEPAIKKESLILVVPNSNYKVNDIITYKKSSTTITHRVVDQPDESVFKTKGDNNETADLDLVNRSLIIGKVIFVLPFFGFLATRNFLILAMLLMGSWYGYSYFISKKNGK